VSVTQSVTWSYIIIWLLPLADSNTNYIYSNTNYIYYNTQNSQGLVLDMKKHDHYKYFDIRLRLFAS